jgi:hypothetical protein
MEDKLYWWISYTYLEKKGTEPDAIRHWGETVVDIHPFTASKMMDKQLVNYKIISEREYKLFNQLNKHKNE